MDQNLTVFLEAMTTFQGCIFLTLRNRDPCHYPHFGSQWIFQALLDLPNLLSSVIIDRRGIFTVVVHWQQNIPSINIQSTAVITWWSEAQQRKSLLTCAAAPYRHSHKPGIRVSSKGQKMNIWILRLHLIFDSDIFPKHADILHPHPLTHSATAKDMYLCCWGHWAGK